MYYQHPSGAVHWYDTHAEREAFGAPGLVAITDAEATELLKPSPPAEPTSAQAIAALLAEVGESRLTIQLTIEVCEDKARALASSLGLTAEEGIALAYAKNKAYRVCKDTEAQIRVLEAGNA